MHVVIAGLQVPEAELNYEKHSFHQIITFATGSSRQSGHSVKVQIGRPS